MMSLTFGLFTQVRGSGPLGPLVFLFDCFGTCFIPPGKCLSIVMSSPGRSPGRAIVLPPASALAKKFNVKVFYVMGKVMSGELSCPCDRSCFLYAVFHIDFSKADIISEIKREFVSLIFWPLKSIFMFFFYFCRARLRVSET